VDADGVFSIPPDEAIEAFEKWMAFSRTDFMILRLTTLHENGLIPLFA
jgi:hypothetical protein